MSLLSCEGPFISNFSTRAGQGRAGSVVCGAGQQVSPLVGAPIPAKYVPSSARPLSFYLNIIIDIVVIIWRGSNLILPLDWKGVLQLSLPIRQSDHSDKE